MSWHKVVGEIAENHLVYQWEKDNRFEVRHAFGVQYACALASAMRLEPHVVVDDQGTYSKTGLKFKSVEVRNDKGEVVS